MNPTPINPPEYGGQLTEAQKRRQRQRSVALAIVLGALVILFYAVTIAKLGGNVLTTDISGGI